MGVDHHAKHFLNVFPGQKAQITDCQVRKQITLTFPRKHTFMHSLYKCLLISHHAPGAGNSAVREIDTAATFPVFTFTLTRAQGILHACAPRRSILNVDLPTCALPTCICRSCHSQVHTFLNFALPSLTTITSTSLLPRIQTDGAQFTQHHLGVLCPPGIMDLCWPGLHSLVPKVGWVRPAGFPPGHAWHLRHLGLRQVETQG